MAEGTFSGRGNFSSVALAAALVTVPGALASENGTSFYLLGSRAHGGAGMTPPPGIFFQNDYYFFSGNVDQSVSIPINREIVAGVDASAVLSLSTILWVTKAEIAGGRLAFTLTVPFGSQDIDGRIGPLQVSDSVGTIADPVLGAFVGGNSGNLHWQAGLAVNIPIGDYDENGLANVSFNRWATDLYTTLTWMNPESGFDVSTTLGFTFNGTNDATDYTSGDDFHAELALTKNFNPAFSLGLASYYFQQISGDSGSGATLGEFKGRAAAIGATMAYTFKMGEAPVTVRLKYFHEFDVENRLEADTGFLTLTMPLWINMP